MRIYADVFEMHSEVRRDIHEMGVVVHPATMQDKDVRDDLGYQTLELSPCVFSVLSGAKRDLWLDSLGLRLDWAHQDIVERLAGFRPEEREPVNPGAAWKHRAETWEPFLHSGRFAYTYSERLFGSIVPIVNLLRDNPDTRQAVMPIFNATLDIPNVGGRARVPCSMHYQFLRRRGALECIYVMRSSDFLTHFPYDIWMAFETQANVAVALGIPLGPLTFFSGSLHIYRKDADPGVF